MNKILYLCTFTLMFTVWPVYQTLNVSGVTILGDDIAYDPGASVNDAIFLITASGVTLDLGGHALSQIGSTAGLRAVEVAAGLTNIEIRNGNISGVTGAGVYVNPGCSNIILNELEIVSTGTRGIEFAGSSGSPIRDCQINHCEILQSGAALSGIGILLTQCSKIRVMDTVVNDCGGSGLAFVAYRLRNCTDCDFTNVSAVSNVGTTFTGIDVVTTSRCNITACIIRNNTGTSTFNGIYFNSGECQNNIVENCSVTANSGATVSGILLEKLCFSNVFKNCTVLGNVGDSGLAGIQFSPDPTINYNNTCISCLVQNNVATTGDCIGYDVNGSDYGLLDNCIASFNTAPAGVAAGLQFTTGTGGSNWYVQNSKFVRNIGDSDANSYGVNWVTGSTNWFVNNVSFNNGATSGNQMNGLAGGSRTSTNTSSVNTNRGFTNIAGIP